MINNNQNKQTWQGSRPRQYFERAKERSNAIHRETVDSTIQQMPGNHRYSHNMERINSQGGI